MQRLRIPIRTAARANRLFPHYRTTAGLYTSSNRLAGDLQNGVRRVVLRPVFRLASQLGASVGQSVGAPVDAQPLLRDGHPTAVLTTMIFDRCLKSEMIAPASLPCCSPECLSAPQPPKEGCRKIPEW